MSSPYGGFVGKIWEEYPQLAEWHDVDESILPIWKLEKFIEKGYHNFYSERKQLYHLSKLIEKYAQENGAPLLATFEEIARYKFVERRYQKMIATIPKVWVVANFGKTQLKTPPKIEVVNCRNTDLVNVWSVITRGPYGPFGLIAEEYENGKFRGFFTLNPGVCRFATKLMSKTLGIKLTIQ